jgi:ATP-dependent DNA helicase RecG
MAMPAEFFSKPVQYLKLIGPRRAVAMQKLGIFTVRDLLYHFPMRYEDRSRLLPAGACTPGEVATIRGTVLAAQDAKPKRGLLPSWLCMTVRAFSTRYGLTSPLSRKP